MGRIGRPGLQNYFRNAAYYLLHSMSAGEDKFEKMEAETAANFRDAMNQRDVEQVVFLSGIINDKELSRHLKSRKRVEEILAGGSYSLTTLRAGIIVGSGSASFEIIRDLVEKLPIREKRGWNSGSTTRESFIRLQPSAQKGFQAVYTGTALCHSMGMYFPE